MNVILPRGAAACAHCGLPLAAGAERFCCAGCAGAYALVAGLGLGAFYRRREGAAGILRPEAGLPPVRFAPHAQPEAGGEHCIDLLVSGLTCGACVWLVEQVLAAEPDMLRARATLSSRRLSLRWRGPAGRADELAAIVARLGFHVVPWSPACLAVAVDAEGRALVRALGIAAFGAFNVMLISLAIWAGAGMGDGTRGLLHWLAAMIALPVVAVAGLPFFRSAWAGLRARRANMDLAVSLGVLAITAMSLSEALRDGPYTWFDSATTLLALLLAGRVLDRSARQRTRRAVAELLALQSGTVRVLNGGGAVRELPAEAVGVGDRLLVTSGERLLLDGVLEGGAEALLDTAATTGESLPRTVPPGDALPAAAVNMGAPFTMRVTSRVSDGSLARLANLLEQAEQARGRFVTLADRVARVFVPVVHALAAATFLLWWLWAGVAWQVALLHAVAVLIVTCPCGLAIAVPAVQVVAVGALFRRGVLVASPSALERLATADCAVLDKTGTLTEGRPALLPGNPPDALRAAASLARASRHPLARAIVRGCPDALVVEGIEEMPGQGLRRGAMRLGSAAFCGVDGEADGALWFVAPDQAPVAFRFTGRLRPDAAEGVAALRALGLNAEVLSGDAPGAVAAAARAAGVLTWRGDATPADKASRIQELRAAGRRPLMVGDGINDAGALVLAHASASPSDGTDLAQQVADVVLQDGRVGALADAVATARRAMRLSRQNIGLSLAYNAVAIPASMLGLITPLLAAVVMAASSLTVILNAMRAGQAGRTRADAAPRVPLGPASGRDGYDAMQAPTSV